MTENEKTTALIPSVGADGGQPPHNSTKQRIPHETCESNPSEENIEEMRERIRRMNDPHYLHTVSMAELYQTAYKSRPPVIDGLLYSGAYILAGAPKIGKSFLVAQLRNVGDSPAINVYTLADIELQFSEDSAGNKKLLPASLLPGFTQALSAEEETDINIHFETSEVKALICELRKASEKNWERLRTNPSHHHYTGAKLIVRVFFKNLMGQWCESTISYEIAWLVYKNPPPQKTHNLNENTIPPKEIREGDEFKAVLSSHHIAPFVFAMTTDKHVIDVLQGYTDESPWLSAVLKDNCT